MMSTPAAKACRAYPQATASWRADQELCLHFDEHQQLDIIATVGMYMTMATIIKTYRVLARTVFELAWDRRDLDETTLERFKFLLGSNSQDPNAGRG